MSNGWDESAAAWITDMADRGDYGREFVLDAPMLDRVRARRFERALDVGCGEGRFCRMMQAQGIRTVGADPTVALIQEARRRDPEGVYTLGRGESLPFGDRSFDLVVSYLTLIDIPDVGAATREMARVLRPGGVLLIANLNSFVTAAEDGGWTREPDGERRFRIDHYLEERPEWVSWRGIRIRNWHRPLGHYMALLLAERLILRHFREPEPRGGGADRAERYRRVPWFVLMEWEKPAE